MPSDLLTRRRLLSGSAATAAAFSGICALHPTDASAPVAKAQGPGVYRYRLGNYQLTALYDGLWPIPIDDDFVRNASRAQVDKAFHSEMAFRCRTTEATENETRKSPAEAGLNLTRWCVQHQHLKALPLPGFLAWPGGQKPFRLAPCLLATIERDSIPVVLA